MLVGRLTGEQIAFVAVRGVDDDRVTDSIAARRQAGATVNGVLWIESKWGNGGDDAKALAAMAGDPTCAARSCAQVQAALRGNA